MSNMVIIKFLFSYIRFEERSIEEVYRRSMNGNIITGKTGYIVEVRV